MDSRLPLAIETYLRRRSTVAGWFTELDALMFAWIDQVQRQCKVRGDLLEIGVFAGKSAILLGCLLDTNEELVVCDVFEGQAADAVNATENRSSYKGLSRECFESNYRAFHVSLPRILQVPSTQLLDAGIGRTFRFMHVDGSHLYDIVRHDTRTAQTLLVDRGVVAFDDYCTGHLPGSAAAVWEAVFRDGLVPVCVSRAKLYGTWDERWAEELQEGLRAWARSDMRVVVDTEPVVGRTLLRVQPAPIRSPEQLAKQWVPLALQPSVARLRAQVVRWVRR
jgi:hypothetical protein